jgi:hypothetical protein
MRWCCGGCAGARWPCLEIFSGAVVEERALEHGPSDTNPRFPPGHDWIPMGCLFPLYSVHMSASLVTWIVIYYEHRFERVDHFA